MGYSITNETWGGSNVTIDGESVSYLYMTRVTADWKSALRGGKEIGFSMGLDARENADVGPNSHSPAISAKYVYGYGSLFDNKLIIKIGKVSDSTFNSGGRLSTDGGEGAGIMFTYAPLTNLKFGAGAYLPEGGGDFELAKYSFGASFELPKIFRINASASIQNNDFKMGTAGIAMLAVDNLRVHAEAFMYPITQGDPHPQTIIDEIVSYRLNDLSFGIDAYQFFNNSNFFLRKGGAAPFTNYTITENQTFKMGLSLDPWVSYQLGDFTPRLGFSYESYGFKDFTATGAEREQNRMIVTVKPSIAYRFSMISQVTLGYTYTLQSDTFTVGGSDSDPEITHDNKISLVFFIFLP
jgi:hypothetical protein